MPREHPPVPSSTAPLSSVYRSTEEAHHARPVPLWPTPRPPARLHLRPVHHPDRKLKDQEASVHLPGEILERQGKAVRGGTPCRSGSRGGRPNGGAVGGLCAVGGPLWPYWP